MRKPGSKSSSHRRLILLIIVLVFGIYLLLDIDFLLVFNIDDVDDIQTIPQIIIEPPHSLPEHSNNSTVVNNNNIKQTNLEKYGFEKEEWHRFKLHPEHCPYYENICIHKQHFYVFNEKELFTLHPDNKHKDIFGQRIQYSLKTFNLYKEIFNARLWNKSINEYELSHCIHDPFTSNHIILSSNYNTMMGEFYLRVLTVLHWIFNYKQFMDKTSRNYKFYVVLPERNDIFLSHKLFLQPYTKYEVQQFIDLFEHYRCKCFDRLFFCGFRQYKQPNYLKAKMEPFDRGRVMKRIHHFNDMINQYQSFVNRHYSNITQDVFKWKESRLKASKVHQKFGVLNVNVSEWRFIGLYQRKKRRTWVNLKEIIRGCNLRYNQYKIVCMEINLEHHYHAKDIIVMHRSVFILIGIHGATLADAVWMENNVGNYIIELLPTNAPDWTSSLGMPTLTAILFWKSTYNYVGLKLLNTSTVYRYNDENKDDTAWHSNDFRVEWNRLMKVIDFL
eukprot:151585_1